MEPLLHFKLKISTIYAIGVIVPCDPSKTVGEIKMISGDLLGMKAEDMTFLFGGKILEDVRTISSYGITFNSLIHVAERGKKSKALAPFRWFSNVENTCLFLNEEKEK